MNTAVQIRKKGQVTIPSAMREKIGMEESDVVNVSLLENGAILIIPQKLRLPEVLKEASELAKKRGVSLEEMLAELDEIRHNS